MTPQLTTQLDTNGYCLVADVFDQSKVDSLIQLVETANRTDIESALQSRGTVFAARNLIDSIPDLLQEVDSPALGNLLAEALGSDFGLVRALYFDKPSDRSWNLPFHKDLTIAVKDNSLSTTHFSKPTRKAGVDHVEASQGVLANMLTLRIHLDVVTESNGPLEVIPGSHQSGKQNEATPSDPVKILCNAGDVLAMRPMLSHGSGHTDPEGNLRRRILHLEFCGMEELADGFQWMHFLRPPV